MRESEIEAYFVARVKEAGGQQRKQNPRMRKGLLDRYAGFPGGRFAFVELKATGEVPSVHQIREMNKWKALGFQCFVIDSKEGVDVFIEFMTR